VLTVPPHACSAQFGLAARLAYLRTYYPELLHPTKARKTRKQGMGRSKFRQPGQNRMSQDGAHGRR
jgi:hypothetical protein